MLRELLAPGYLLYAVHPFHAAANSAWIARLLTIDQINSATSSAAWGRAIRCIAADICRRRPSLATRKHNISAS